MNRRIDSPCKKGLNWTMAKRKSMLVRCNPLFRGMRDASSVQAYPHHPMPLTADALKGRLGAG